MAKTKISHLQVHNVIRIDTSELHQFKAISTSRQTVDARLKPPTKNWNSDQRSSSLGSGRTLKVLARDKTSWPQICTREIERKIRIRMS